MKSYKEYLAESKKVYEFKIKIAGDHAKDAVAQIKAALAEFHVSSVSAGKTTPIQERQTEFPQHKNTQMTVYDVTTEYPATNLQIRDRVVAGLGVTHGCVKVRNMAEEREHEINHEHDERSGKAVVGTMQDPSNHSNLVDEEHKLGFLKELNKEKHQGTQVKGINDTILASSIPVQAKEYRKEKGISKEKGVGGPFSKQNKIPSPLKRNA